MSIQGGANLVHAPAKKCVKRVKTLETAEENFLIGNLLARQPLSTPIDSDALGALEFFVIEISIVNHFSNLIDPCRAMSCDRRVNHFRYSNDS
jgi:hypothetical protein